MVILSRLILAACHFWFFSAPTLLLTPSKILLLTKDSSALSIKITSHPPAGSVCASSCWMICLYTCVSGCVSSSLVSLIKQIRMLSPSSFLHSLHTPSSFFWLHPLSLLTRLFDLPLSLYSTVSDLFCTLSPVCSLSLFFAKPFTIERASQPLSQSTSSTSGEVVVVVAVV